MSTCKNCKYFTQCGDSERTEPCNGYERRMIMTTETIMKFNNTPVGNHLIMQQGGDYTMIAKYNQDGSFHEYVVCCQYNAKTGTWWHGHYFWHDLKGASEFLRIQTDSNYIARNRAIEIATIALHALEENELLEDYKYDLDLDKIEMEFFGISEDEEDEDYEKWYAEKMEEEIFPEDDEDEDYVPSATNGDYSPSNPWDAPGMNIWDFI